MLTRFHRLCRRLLPLVLLAVLVLLDCTLAKSLVLDRHALRAHSVASTAQITARTLGHTRLVRAFSGPDPAVTYTFEAGGRKYARTQRVALGTYQALPRGATALITYLRRDPHVSALAGSVTLGSVLIPAVALFGLNAAFAMAWIWRRRTAWQQRFAEPRREVRAPDRELPFSPVRRFVSL
jgi:hypothetical protein